MDKIEIDQVLKFEQMLYNKLDTTHKSLSENIIKKQTLDEEIENWIKDLISITLKEIEIQ